MHLEYGLYNGRRVSKFLKTSQTFRLPPLQCVLSIRHCPVRLSTISDIQGRSESNPDAYPLLPISVVDDTNLIGIHNGGQFVSNHHEGLAFYKFCNGCFHLFFNFRGQHRLLLHQEPQWGHPLRLLAPEKYADADRRRAIFRHRLPWSECPAEVFQ